MHRQKLKGESATDLRNNCIIACVVPWDGIGQPVFDTEDLFIFLMTEPRSYVDWEKHLDRANLRHMSNFDNCWSATSIYWRPSNLLNQMQTRPNSLIVRQGLRAHTFCGSRTRRRINALSVIRGTS